MGGLGQTYAAFAERWQRHERIMADFALFAREARTVLAALAERIERESDILYPLAAITPDQVRSVA